MQQRIDRPSVKRIWKRTATPEGGNPSENGKDGLENEIGGKSERRARGVSKSPFPFRGDSISADAIARLRFPFHPSVCFWNAFCSCDCISDKKTIGGGGGVNG